MNPNPRRAGGAPSQGAHNQTIPPPPAPIYKYSVVFPYPEITSIGMKPVSVIRRYEQIVKIVLVIASRTDFSRILFPYDYIYVHEKYMRGLPQHLE
jgi:hypothetical protein